MKIIVWKTKGDPRYYDATTLEAWDASAIRILEEMLNGGYLDPEMYRPYITDEMRKAADVTQYLHTMPEQFREIVENARRTIEREERQYETAKRQHSQALEYVTVGSSPRVSYGREGRKQRPASWDLLQERNGAEYENFYLEDVFTIREDA